MESSLPKVLQKIAGQPMLAHVIAAARGLRPAGVHVVHGHGGGQVRDAFVDQEDLQWVEQARQLGTGHAVRQAMPDVRSEEHTSELQSLMRSSYAVFCLKKKQQN